MSEHVQNADTKNAAAEKSNVEVSVNDERAQRRARRQALLDSGINPYPIQSEVTAHVSELEDRYASLENGESTEDEYSVAGRVRAIRNQGKIAFVVIEDYTGQLQLFCRINNLDEASWDLLGMLDLGDIIGATGTIMRTRRGQLSIAPTRLVLLSKSLRPLPEKFHGLTDREVRYRQRYVDLIMNPEVRDVFRKRSQIISIIRQHMEEDGYMEVETPVLQEILGGANAKPFITHYNALNTENYLRIATELPLKRLIVGGLERVFEIGRQFRNEGMDLTHNPEFTSMEAYAAYSDLVGMRKLSQELFQDIARHACGCEAGHEVITFQGTEIDLSGEWRVASLSEIASEVTGENLSIDTPVEKLREVLDRFDIEWNVEWGAGKLLFEIYDELGEKSIINPTFVCDYPAEVSPLTKRKDDDPRLTDRFELVIKGAEYANAYSELNDPVDQEERFAAQMEAKRQGDDEAMEYDYDFIRALEYGMPPAGGIGYGIDRMIMLFCDQPSIRDVLLFPQMRPSKTSNKEAYEDAGAKEEGASEAASEATSEVAAETAFEASGFFASNEKIDFSGVKIEPLFTDFVDFDTFSKSDFRAVKVKECSAVPKSKKLLKFVLDDGTDTDRVILSGIHAYYEPDELVGKTLIAITNLPPRAMMGIDSCGMLLSAVNERNGEEELHLLMVDNRIPAGAKLY